jgi:hypothetical protein
MVIESEEEKLVADIRKTEFGAVCIQLNDFSLNTAASESFQLPCWRYDEKKEIVPAPISALLAAS